jgi:hypothetical protein
MEAGSMTNEHHRRIYLFSMLLTPGDGGVKFVHFPF